MKKYLIKLLDCETTYVKNFGRYFMRTRKESEKDECLKTEKELKHCLEILEGRYNHLKYEVITIEQ